MNAIASLILTIALEVGIQPYFALAIALEENWTLNENAISKPNKNGSRDYGLFQLNDSVYDMEKINWRDPATNIRLGCEHIKYLLGRPEMTTYFDVAVSYNAGCSWLVNGHDPPAKSVEYACKVIQRWNELSGGNAMTLIRRDL